ncbi:MAG: hypothetical protein LBH46_00305 [Rickettsiales bacterium]|jgi:hypothetical protein|nr:hypothetical protein [Rickettsiales bacterium]
MKYLILLLFFVTSCATIPPELVLPEWVKNADECHKDKICQTGSGISQTEANRNAINNLSKYYESNTGVNINKNKIEITQSYTENGVFHALASLDKKKNINELKNGIEKIDNKMLIFSKEKTLGASVKLEKLYNERIVLNKQYEFLTNKPIPEKISYDDIIQNKKIDTNTSYYIDFTDIKNINEEELKNLIASIITDAGASVSNDLSSATNIIDIKISHTKEFLKVENFEKYRVLYRIQNIKNNSSVGVFTGSYSETGKSLEQIISKTNEQFADELKENINKLLK